MGFGRNCAQNMSLVLAASALLFLQSRFLEVGA